MESKEHFRSDEIIVSKTDKSGIITYANDVFLDISGFSEDELIGKPHNIVRHPGMPRAVYKLLWDTILSGNEIFAYVINRAKSGDEYWVFAHVTPNVNAQGEIIGFHSNRRSPRPAAVTKIHEIYNQILVEENKHSDRASGLESSYRLMVDLVRRAGFDGYDRFVLSL